MNRLHKRFDCYPKFVPAGKESKITIQVGKAYGEGTEVQLQHLPMEYKFAADHTVHICGGKIDVSLCFEHEQEHYLCLYIGEELIGRAYVYSLEDDLYGRLPMKGDFHMHSNRSDGCEAPAVVGACCRKVGFDIMALTDHYQYAPSGEVQKAFEQIPHDLIICRGEEVHLPRNPVHIINFGGSYSVNDYAKEHEEEYKAQAKALGEKSSVPMNEAEKFTYGSSVFAFDHIRRGGGVAIYCHPYWLYPGRKAEQGYYVSAPVNEALMRERPFDALEAIGGYAMAEDQYESNHLQIAAYQQWRAEGFDIPPVGVSDAHGCLTECLFGWYYTITFAAGYDEENFKQAIRDGYTVAVEQLPGQEPHAFGSFRLVKLAQFVMREVFPRHDQLCRQEGLDMLGALAGDQKCIDALEKAKGQVQAYIRRCTEKEEA